MFVFELKNKNYKIKSWLKPVLIISFLLVRLVFWVKWNKHLDNSLGRIGLLFIFMFIWTLYPLSNALQTCFYLTFMNFLLFAWYVFPCVSLVSVYSSLVQYDDKRFNMLSIEFQLPMLGFLQKSDWNEAGAWKFGSESKTFKWFFL